MYWIIYDTGNAFKTYLNLSKAKEEAVRRMPILGNSFKICDILGSHQIEILRWHEGSWIKNECYHKDLNVILSLNNL